MWPLGSSGTRDDGDSFLVDRHGGGWRAIAIERPDLVVLAVRLDGLRQAILDASVARRRDERRMDRAWKVAYLWGAETAPASKNWLRSIVSAFKPGRGGPVLEVAPDGGAGYTARAEDGSTVTAGTLDELTERVRQRYAPQGGADPPPSISLYEVLGIPAETAGDGR